MNVQFKIQAETLPGALIGGQWRAGSGGSFEVRSPETREVLHEIGRCTTDDVNDAIA